MSQPPKVQNLNREDFPEQASWIDSLLRPLNSFMTSTAAAFANVSRADNMQSQVEEFVFTTTGSAGLPGDALFISVKKRFKPTILLVGSMENLTTPTASFPTAVFPTWEVSNDVSGMRVKIRALSGLSADTKYRIRFIVE